MNSSGAVLIGSQEPTLLVQPPSARTAGGEAAELADAAGLVLDPWQRTAVDMILAERDDGMWASRSSGVIVPRQNGKGDILIAVELYLLFVVGLPLILHTAHEVKTALEGWLRLRAKVQNTPSLHRRVKRYVNVNGQEGLELHTGQRLKFIARSKSSGRGFSAPCVIFDECQDLPAAVTSASVPALSAMPNPKLIYSGSAPPAADEASAQVRRLRRRARSETPGRLSWLEFASEPDVDPADVEAIARVNPAYGVRIQAETVREELDGDLTPEGYLCERMGVWPLEADELGVFDEGAWEQAADPGSQATDPVEWAIDTSPDRKWTSVAVAGTRVDGFLHGEVVYHEAGTAGVVDWVSERTNRVVIDPASPAGSLIDEFVARGVEVVSTTPRDMAQACGAIADAVSEGLFRHRDQPVLNAAVAIAAIRPLSDSWAWSRKSPGDISPLVALTLAVSAARKPVEAVIDAAANVW